MPHPCCQFSPISKKEGTTPAAIITHLIFGNDIVVIGDTEHVCDIRGDILHNLRADPNRSHHRRHISIVTYGHRDVIRRKSYIMDIDQCICALATGVMGNPISIFTHIDNRIIGLASRIHRRVGAAAAIDIVVPSIAGKEIVRRIARETIIPRTANGGLDIGIDPAGIGIGHDRHIIDIAPNTAEFPGTQIDDPILGIA